MAKFTVKDLQEALKNLDKDKEIMVLNSYSANDKIEVEYIKELKENGKEYYKINIQYSFLINFNKQNYGNKQKKPDVYHQ